MKAYWIGRVNVTDPEAYAKYAELAGPAIKTHGGRFLVRGGKHEAMEGTAYARNIVIEFDGFDAAKRCYASPDYQAALEFAKGASVRDIVLVEGLD